MISICPSCQKKLRHPNRNIILKCPNCGHNFYFSPQKIESLPALISHLAKDGIEQTADRVANRIHFLENGREDVDINEKSKLLGCAGYNSLRFIFTIVVIICSTIYFATDNRPASELLAEKESEIKGSWEFCKGVFGDEKQLTVCDSKLLFDFNSFELTDIGKIKLNKLIDNAGVRLNFSIAGHADNTGSDQYNLLLSQQRALVVAEYLRSRTDRNLQIHIVGYGESRPIASNETHEGRAENRRVEIIITANEPQDLYRTLYSVIPSWLSFFGTAIGIIASLLTIIPYIEKYFIIGIIRISKVLYKLR